MSVGWEELGRRLEIVSVVVLWVAVLLRMPASVRVRSQRGLWVAVAAAAAAMTLSLAAGWLVRHKGVSYDVGLLANLSGMVSASAVLDFAVTATGRGKRYRRPLYLVAGAAILALAVVDRLAPPHAQHTVGRAGDSHPGTAYWWILVGAHLAADVVCVWVCRRCRRRSENPVVRTTLRLFGLGTVFSGVYWAGQGIRLVWPAEGVVVLLPFCMFLHALLRASALMIPIVSVVRRAACRVVTIRRLWPLWYDLTSLVPHVVLDPRRSWAAELLRPRGPLSLLQYRKVIEIRDALLVVQNFCHPSASEEAGAYLRTVSPPPVSHDAAVLACVLHQGRKAMLSRRPTQTALVAGDFRTDDLDEETAFLVQVAVAYSTPSVRDFDVTR
ncbi:MAB_1171c family putative transporter [Streptomyces sp. NPDC054863]